MSSSHKIKKIVRLAATELSIGDLNDVIKFLKRLLRTKTEMRLLEKEAVESDEDDDGPKESSASSEEEGSDRGSESGSDDESDREEPKPVKRKVVPKPKTSPKPESPPKSSPKPESPKEKEDEPEPDEPVDPDDMEWESGSEVELIFDRSPDPEGTPASGGVKTFEIFPDLPSAIKKLNAEWGTQLSVDDFGDVTRPNIMGANTNAVETVSKKEGNDIKITIDGSSILLRHTTNGWSLV